jgi:acyl-CoA synthetase (AMP-forming)/AMP-acid ligase II/acyl carrier protein
MTNEDSMRPGRTTGPFSSVSQILQHQAGRIPDAPAILAPGRPPLSYGLLYQLIDGTVRALRATGIGRRDRVAVVLPNGPELAVVILGVEACAVCAPLNPAYGVEELERYFADLQPRALITQAGTDCPARRVALSRGVRVLELSTVVEAQARLFTITGALGSATSHEPVSDDDVALLLPTSGTTSRPKIVPLTHVNICTSAYASAVALALRETDRCLNVLPLFHGHGLNATVLASLTAGASVVCTTGLEVNSFFTWLRTFEPTWFSAVPTMHQALLAQARQNREQVANSRLRFVRSSSAPLPPQVFTELERTFRAPVIEYYGMTETASAPIACNPLPPGHRKVGSVGKPIGLEVSIIDDAGTMLPGCETGEVVVRGVSVTSGYDGDSLVKRPAFVDGWFRTGDHGYFDEGGYLFLVGRKQEIINRGGEKIAPREIDEVLLEHPAVAEAATFAVPHPTLGEDVATAVVLRPNATATPRDLRKFVIGRVADFKVPRQVLIVSELQKGPTGKLQRVGLAAKLGLANRAIMPRIFVAPRTPVEKALANRWAEILQVKLVGIHDDFFALGGDSLLVAQAATYIHDAFDIQVDIARFFEAPTVAEVAQHVETLIHKPGPSGQTALTIPRVARDDGTPASFAQARLWKLQEMLPDIPFFNALSVLRLTAAFDAAAFEQSINEIVRRHEILRTTFTIVGQQCMAVVAPQLPISLAFDDLRALTESRKEAIGQEIVQEEALRSFDLDRGPLFRVRLVRLAEREHLFLIAIHQVISDRWSIGVLVEELANLYDAFSARGTSTIAPLPVQYTDFACWQREWRRHPEMASHLEYWREQLRDPMPVMRLSSAYRERAIDDLRTARRGMAVPARLSEAVKRFSQQEGGTLFMALVAALKTLLHRHLRQEDLRVGTIVANRNRSGTERLIGPLANMVILRTNLSGDPNAREVMRRVRATTLEAFAHQELPFEELVTILQHERAVKPTALVQVMILLQNATLSRMTGSGRRLAFEEINPSMLVPLATLTTADITLMLYEGPQGLAGTCVYKPYLFDVNFIDGLLRDFRLVLKQMVTHPERAISEMRFSPRRKLPDA